MTDTLLVEKNQIAQEFLNTTDVQAIFRNFFPVIKGFLTNFHETISPEAPAVALTASQFIFFKELSKHSYTDVSHLAAYVPEGLNVSYLKYAKELQESAEHAANILYGVLSSYSIFLSSLITNQDQKLDTTSFIPVYKKLEAEREKMNKDIGGCFTTGSTKSELTIGDVVERNADWLKVFEQTHVLTKLINNVDRKALNKKITECIELLDAVKEKMKRSELDNISKETSNNLAEGAYQIANELEFFSVTYFKVIGLTNSINTTIAHFFKVCNNF